MAATKFRTLLTSRGLTTTDAAAALTTILGERIDRSTISCLQTGKSRPSLYLAAAIEVFSGGYIRAAEWAELACMRAA